MARSSTTFQKGTAKGKPKGAVNKATRTMKERIAAFLDGQDLDALVRKLEPKEKADFIAKLLPYAVPRVVETPAPDTNFRALLLALAANMDTNA